jgi:hypothetical protein
MAENLPGSYAAVNHPPTENVAAERRQVDPMHGKPSEVFLKNWINWLLAAQSLIWVILNVKSSNGESG